VSTIVCSSIDFNYTSPYSEVFTNLSLVIDTRWKTGLIGRNGRGKSTLLGLISGELLPTSGHLTCPVETRAFPGHVGDHDAPVIKVARDLVAPFDRWEAEMEALLKSASPEDMERYAYLQARYQDTGGYEIDGLIEREFDLMGLSMGLLDRPYGELSSGQQTRVQIVSLFLSRQTYPLIDEPTNHLDLPGRKAVAEYLKGQKGFLLVSHDRALLDACTDHTVSINRSDVRVNRGNWSQWHTEMTRELESEQKSRARIEGEVAQLQRAARDRRDGAQKKESEKYGNSHADTGFIGHKAAKQMKRALSTEKRIATQLEDKQKLLANQEKTRELVVTTDTREGRLQLSVNNLTIRLGGTTLVKNLSFTVSGGERLVLLGANGCGKTSVLNAIAGQIEFDGVVNYRGRSISRSWQYRLWSEGMLRDHLVSSQMDETRFRQYLGSFDVRGDIFDQPLETFSQGQLKKVDLTRSMMTPADLLIWDEPVNYLDLDTREMLEAGILRGAPTMILIEHDERFVEAVSTTVIRL